MEREGGENALSSFSCACVAASMVATSKAQAGGLFCLAMSLRSFSLLGSTLSVYGGVKLGSALAVLDFGHLGSGLSFRSFVRGGEAVRRSVFERNALGGARREIVSVH